MTRDEVLEFERKVEKIRAYLNSRGPGAALIGRRDNFAWISGGGDNTVVRGSEIGFGILLVTADKVRLVAYTMDAARIRDDELLGADIEVVSLKWHEGSREECALSFSGGRGVLSDIPVMGVVFDPGAFFGLHYPLSPLEIRRCRELGAKAESVLRRVADTLSPEVTEAAAARALDSAYALEGMAVDVLLVGGSSRIAKYRHPLPSNNRLGETVLLHSAARLWGLHANVTRMMTFGPPSPEFEKAYDAVARLQALTVSMTRPGVHLLSIFEKRRALYAKLGYPDEWELHFPGGNTGYVLCQAVAIADPEARVGQGMAFDWFVTVTGAKVEELCLSGELGGELVSAAGGWPTRAVAGFGVSVDTPWILQR